MAPEVLNHENYCPKMADIFSCGVVLFCMATGCMPFQNDASSNDNMFKLFHENR